MLFNKKKKIRIVNIDGVISAAASKGVLNQSDGSMAVLKTLHEIKNDDSIRGVLLRINSPGGTAGASQEIAQLVEDVRKAGKPIVASIADIACSGGYMIASVCDYIFANQMAMTGSIGVIMQIPNFKGISEKLGVTYNTIKAGEMKDIGNPMREMTDKERDYLTVMVAESHVQFINMVQKYRQIKNIEEMTDGRFVTAAVAKENGLIDEFGTYYDALDYLCKKLNVTEKEVKIIEDNKKKSFIGKILNLQAVVKEVLQITTELKL